MYTVTFTDKYGNSVTYNAMTREQAEQIAAEYASDYPGSTVTITGTGPNPAQSPDVQAIAEDNVQQPHYRVIFKNDEGSSAYTALTKQQAEKIAEEYRKYYKGSQVLILTPTNELERVSFRQIRVPRSASSAPTTLSSSRQVVSAQVRNRQNVTDVKATKPSPPTSLDLDGALRRAAMDSSPKKLEQQSAELYAWQLLRKGLSPEQVAQKVANRYGTQVSVEDVQFSETPMHAMQQQEQVQKTIEKQNVKLNAPPPNTLIGEDSTVNADVQKLAMSNLKSEMEEPDPVSNYLHQISKEIGVKTTPLEKVYAKGNPASAYVAAAGLAVAGAAAGVLDLPYDVAKGGAEAVEHPVRAAESFALAPVTVVKEAAEDAASGRMIDYGKVVGQTLVGGEVADELGLSPSKVWEKLPDRITSPVESVAEKVLAPAREFAERVHSKLNDAVVRPIKEFNKYRPQETWVYIETPDDVKTTVIKWDNNLRSTTTPLPINDLVPVERIKPVVATIGETAYQMDTESGIGVGVSKLREKIGYELETREPIKSIKSITEYSNRLGRKAYISTELGEDAIKILLTKNDIVKGYGIKTLETTPILDLESNIDYSLSPDMSRPLDTLYREDNQIDSALDVDLNVVEDTPSGPKESKSVESKSSSSSYVSQALSSEEEYSFKVVDLSDKFRELERTLTENRFEVPDFVKDLFDAGKELGKGLLDRSAALPFEGVWNAEGMWSSGVPWISTKGEISGNVISKMFSEEEAKPKVRSKQTPGISPDVGEKPDTSPDVTPDVSVDALTQALTATLVDYSNETKTKTKQTRPEPPVPPLFLPGGGGENFWEILEPRSRKTRRGVKINPIVNDPLKILWG